MQVKKQKEIMMKYKIIFLQKIYVPSNTKNKYKTQWWKKKQW